MLPGKIYPVNMKEKVKSVGSANNLGSLSVTNFGGLYATVRQRKMYLERKYLYLARVLTKA